MLSATAQYAGATIAVHLFAEVAPATVAWIRVIGAATALLVVSAPHLLGRGRRRFTRGELLSLSVFGIATALMNMFFYLAIDRLPLGKGVAIEFIGPIAVAAFFTRTRRNWTALGFAAAGVAVLSGVEIGGEPLGLLYIFTASVMWAVYIVIGSRVARNNHGVSGLGLGLVVGTLVVAPVGAPGSGDVWTSPRLLVLCLLVGVLSNAIGYGIDQFTMRRIPMRRFSVLLALLPVTATLSGFIALDQTPSVIDLVGIALVLAGVVTQEREEIPAAVDPRQ